MSEFLLELFSEEMPPKLQINSRKNLLEGFNEFFEENNINLKGKVSSYSTPNRLVVFADKIPKNIFRKSVEIRGPGLDAPDTALKGFLKSNKITKNQIFKKKTEKGIFYFHKAPSKKIKTLSLLEENIPIILDKITWNKSMKWGYNELFWGRPLKSILAIFEGEKIGFDFHHLKSSNTTFIDKNFEEKTKIFKSYKAYKQYFKSIGVIIENEKRKSFIKNEISKISKKKNLKIYFKEKLLDEISNIVEKPKILLCEFDKKYLEVPKEILIITMQNHQKYFPTFNKEDKVTNNFFVIADIKDQKGLIKLGNERVIEARLSDAEFFWKRNKSQNLVKQVSKLKEINYFKGLGTYFDKVQRIRKLSSLISDDLLISKEKIEIASTICKVDLMSDLVGEFPELQGIMGGYFANAQGFDKEVSLAVSEHYLPIGMDSRLPKNSYSIVLSLSDKIDSLVGFFGINLKPTSSKDPFAIRRMAISLVRLIVENNLNIKIRDLINYSCVLYKEQNFNFEIKILQNDLVEFILDRFKNYLKDKQIRNDIIESSSSIYAVDELLKIYKKSLTLNKNIKRNLGIDVVSIYKRSSSILSSERDNKSEIIGSADPGIFKNEFEKNLYKKIHVIRKYFSSSGREENYEESLKMLSSAKDEVNAFFDNVIVNDDDPIIKKNRLELLKMLCKSFDSYFNFSKIEA